MRRFEYKYWLFLFIHVPELIKFLKKHVSSRMSYFLDEIGPIILFGPVYGRKFVSLKWYSLLTLLVLSLLMIGGPLASVFTFLFGLMGSAIYLLGISALNILWTYMTGGTPLPGVGPIIPGVQVGPYYIPFAEGWLSILLIFLIHEGAHGLIALRRGIPITDAGMVLLTVVPVAAYVMPDEEKFKRTDPSSRVSVLSAGPTANVLAFILTALLVFALTPILSPTFDSYYHQYALGVKVLSVPENVEINGEYLPSLVHGKMNPGDIIVAINGERVYTIADILRILHEANTGEITLTVLSGGVEKNIVIPNKGYLGIQGGEVAWKENPPLSYHILRFLISFLGIFYILNLMVAIVNALPFSFLDGGQAIEELERMGGPKVRPLKILTLLLLVINVLPWFIT